MQPFPNPSSALCQALALLGKLGGLNRRWLKEPQPLDLRDNPEHGLRLILTFEPQTSFLVRPGRIRWRRRSCANEEGTVVNEE